MSNDTVMLFLIYQKAAELGDSGKALFPLHKRRVEVELHLGDLGNGKATVLGSDLSHEYVNVNADYRS
jgi:N-acetylglutamate synthase/N-acetylornithine aminotransferase